MRKSLPIFIAILITSISVAALAAENSATPAPAAGVVNINTADVAQLSLLPRIGAKVAQRIVDYRKEHGAFKSLDQLASVKGIGLKTVEKNRESITLGGAVASK